MSVAAPTVRDFWDATDFAQRVLPLPSPVPWIEGAAAVELRSGEDVLARMPTHAAPAIEVDFPSRARSSSKAAETSPTKSERRTSE
jgi:hypothetical protein